MATVPATEPDDKLTYEDYCRIPEDGMRHEVLGGEHVVSPSPGEKHQDAVLAVGSILRGWCKRSGSGRVFIAPFDVLLGPHDIVQPDVLFIRRANLEILAGPHVRGAPDLVVEVLSPSSGRRDLVDKLTTYARSGVLEYWVIDPELRRVEVFRAQGPAGDGALVRVEERWGAASEVLTSPLLEGLEIPLAELFE